MPEGHGAVGAKLQTVKLVVEVDIVVSIVLFYSLFIFYLYKKIHFFELKGSIWMN